MRIPNADRAVIEPAKLHSYLLSRSHPVGRFKAAFFGALGYTQENWAELQQDLLRIATEDAAVQASSAGSGTSTRFLLS